MSNNEKIKFLIDFIKSNQILKHIIVLGDFNIDFKNKTDGNFVKEISKKLQLIQITNQYTTKKIQKLMKFFLTVEYMITSFITQVIHTISV